MDAWRWRYLENPYGGPLIDLMWSGDKLVGQYAVSPIDMSIDGKTYPCAFSLDTMTHPEYGGRGIFTRLATSLYHRIAQAGRVMVWGFPNENSRHGFIKRLAWFDVASIPMLCLRSRLDGYPQTEIRPLEEVDTQVDDLFQQERKHWYCLAVRSAQYLEWRFFHRPGRRYYAAGAFYGGKLVGYSIYKLFRTREQTVGDIVDLFCVQDVGVFTDLIIWTAQDLIRQGVQVVDIWMNEHSPFYSVLQAIGFVSGALYTFFGGRVFSSALSTERLMEWPNWYIQMGDSDVY